MKIEVYEKCVIDVTKSKFMLVVNDIEIVDCRVFIGSLS